jgi:branched-chain amino acid transport system ATP-binding protein
VRKTLLLSVKNLTVHYGKVPAIRNLNLDVPEGEVIALIGNNGAGKTTSMRAISGLKHPTEGEVWLDGQRIESMSPEKVNRLGVAHIPEGRRVWPQLSILENLEMGAFPRSDRAAVRADMKLVFEHFPVLGERQDEMAGNLSGGQQQMLAMGRALMAHPRIILMDEPSLGLSPKMCTEIAKIIQEMHREGRTILLVEQNARLALSLAEQGYVLETGQVVLNGPARELLDNEEVKRTYLGG